MCGIAGIFRYDDSSPVGFDAGLGLAMTDALVHRGPDDGGLLIGDGVMLGHRRLSVIDLSSEGHQPMSDDDQQVWITYNGEVYNFQTLRHELEAAGHRFRSDSDTEVILRGYLQWGHDVAKRINGMFAFAIWDRRDNSLWLVRDGIGIKPLYYKDDGQHLRFGSEIKAILADPLVGRAPNWEAIDSFLTFGYTPAPQTAFQGIHQLLPGESLLARGGAVHRTVWKTLPYPDRPENWSANECADRLGAAIDSAVKRQMVSDVPVGAMLSGGLDSSAVVRSMQKEETNVIDTFTIGFAEGSFDESPYASQVAEIYGTNHRRDQVDVDVICLLGKLISHADDPFADNSMIPFYLLSEQVRRHVTVALSGDGADELLAGYDTYRASQFAPYYRLIPKPLRRAVITPLVNRLPASTAKYGLPNVLRRFVAAAGEPAPRDHCNWRRYVSSDLRTRLFQTRHLENLDCDAVGAYVGALDDAPDWLSPLGQQLHMDLRFHLPNDMLVKVDRMSMAHALEVRVPLLDDEVVETCLAMPASQKRRGKSGKLPLRRLLADDLPPKLIDRKKAGFLSPIESWLQGPWQPMLKELLSEEFVDETSVFRHATITDIINQQAARRGDYAYPLFALLVLAIWWRIWITQEWPTETSELQAAPTRIQRLA
ncbi:asparagine synthase (glutamine-hydrolyzing) [Planctomycetes bacterium K23_9]|uniref:asparagine synthase (glutamine-hydrolyzing) n=1 Tax=Stieleria marina TaxID=1930275 RepID=A0A517NN91_9BACT|nr:Asparagine synthetase [glutamine-hydrolyzing] 1 [Planctomycetes bacterium K23_9]